METKPTGLKQSIAGWKQSIVGMEIFVDFVKAALAASVSSTADKTLSLCSFVFFKKLCDSVTLCLKYKLRV